MIYDKKGKVIFIFQISASPSVPLTHNLICFDWPFLFYFTWKDIWMHTHIHTHKYAIFLKKSSNDDLMTRFDMKGSETKTRKMV